MRPTIIARQSGQLEQRIAGPVFLRGEDLEILCGALRDDIFAEGSLQQFELLQSQAGNAPVGGMSTLPFSR
jgi:hypothetical protein